MEEYKTAAAFGTDEFTEKKSRFIGYVSPVSSEEEAIGFINEIRAKHRDASHNVYAYSLREGQIKRASDDGEPQGAGGIPLLNVLCGAELTDVCCVVTRYFGGTLLGVGGLCRAYTEGAKIAVAAAGTKTVAESADVKITSDYSLFGKIEHFLNEGGFCVLKTEFGAEVSALVRVRKENLSDFKRDITELTAAKAALEVVAEGWSENIDHYI